MEVIESENKDRGFNMDIKKAILTIIAL